MSRTKIDNGVVYVAVSTTKTGRVTWRRIKPADTAAVVDGLIAFIEGLQTQMQGLQKRIDDLTFGPD